MTSALQPTKNNAFPFSSVVDVIDASNFASAASLETHRWSIILVSDEVSAEKAAQEFALYLELETDWAVQLIRVVSARELTALLQTSRDLVVVLYGVSAFDTQDWRSLDLSRSRLLAPALVLLIMTEIELNKLDRFAPNLMSLMNANVQLWDDVTSRLKEQRLSALRARFDLSDAEVIALATDGKLPSEPEFGEWLMLMGKGELLHG